MIMAEKELLSCDLDLKYTPIAKKFATFEETGGA
jgi:hypothetical protein